MYLRSKKSVLLMGLALVALVAIPALAKTTFRFNQAGLQLDVPDGWKSEVKDDVLTVSQEDDDIAIVAWQVANKDFDAAADALGDQLEKIVKNAKPDGEAKKIEINGLTAVALEGAGEIEGKTVKWAVLFVKAEHPVIFVGFAAPEALNKHAEDVHAIFGSIRAAE